MGCINPRAPELPAGHRCLGQSLAWREDFLEFKRSRIVAITFYTTRSRRMFANLHGCRSQAGDLSERRGSGERPWGGVGTA